jgi:DNA-binding Lrp family transcriptional regulator
MSRQKVLREFEGMGIAVDAFDNVDTNTLLELLKNIKETVKEKGGDGHQAHPADYKRPLSAIDKKILKALLSSTGDVSSLSLSRELGIPLSTVQRRRKRLETYLLDMSYTLKVDKFGLRTADLFISTKNGMTDAVAKELLSLNAGIRSVSRVLGTSPADIMAAIVFKSNSDLLKIVERIKAIKGVGSISWVEVMASLGQNGNFSNIIIDGQ